MHAITLLNEHAGPAPQYDAAVETKKINGRFRRHNVRSTVLAFDGGGLDEALKDAIQRSPDLLVAAGGDGTVNAVARAALEHDIPVAVLPYGTRNHFARDVGVPRTVPEAIDVAAKGRIRRVDVGDVNGHLFLNNSSIGVYPKLVRDRDELRDAHGHGKLRATARAGFKLIKRHPTLEVEIKTPKGLVEHETPFVFVGNNPYDLNFFVLGRRKRLDTGRLSLYYSMHGGRSASLRLALRSLLGSLDPDRDFQAMNVRKLTLKSRRSRLRVAYDGEIQKMKPPLHYQSRPGALRVMRPRGARGKRT